MEHGLLKFFESDEIHISALVISDYSFNYSHWNADQSLAEWLKESRIPGIYGIDTRALTKHLREEGAMLGKILFDDEDIPLYDPNLENLVDQVSVKEVTEYGRGKYRILLVAGIIISGNSFRIIVYHDPPHPLLTDGFQGVYTAPVEFY